MSYEPDMSAAANRHYEDASHLLLSKRFSNAGYHFGLSAECAIKQKLLNIGVMQTDKSYWIHFPQLLQAAALAASSRSAGALNTLLGQKDFMTNWDVKMRYSTNNAITKTKVEKWKKEANQALGLLI
jgi:hypothetical protein